MLETSAQIISSAELIYTTDNTFQQQVLVLSLVVLLGKLHSIYAEGY